MPTPQEKKRFDIVDPFQSATPTPTPQVGGVSSTPPPNLGIIDPFATSTVSSNGIIDPFADQPQPGFIAKYVAPVVSPIVDVLSRGQYASARFFDSLVGDVRQLIDDPNFSFSDFFSKRREETAKAIGEAFSPEMRLSFSDVIKRRAPEFAKNHSTSTAVLGFAGDVLLDPTTYLGVGLAGRGLKVGGKVLTKEGKQVFDELIERGLAGGMAEFQGNVTKHELKRLETAILDQIEKESPNLIVPSGPRLTFVGRQITPALTRENFQAIGLDFLYDSIKGLGTRVRDIPGVSTIGKVFSRNYDLPKEYVELRRVAENNLENIGNDVIRDTRKLFQDIPKAEREDIARTMHLVESEKRRLSNSLNRELTDSEIAQIYQTASHNLSPDGKAIVAGLQQSYKRAIELEMSVDSLSHLLKNPAMYEVIEDSRSLRNLLKARKTYGFVDDLTSRDVSKYFTKEELESQGFLPELDAAVLYANRLINARQAASKADFLNSVKLTFGVNSSNDLPKTITDDLRFFGDGLYSSSMSETGLSVLKTLDRAQGLWKGAATVVKFPQFAIKQGIANTLQAALVTGVRAFKGFDPRAAIDAALFFAPKPVRDFLPETFRNFIGKYLPGDAVLAERATLARMTGEDRFLQFAKDYKMKNVFGEEFTGEQLYNSMRQNGIIKGFDVTGERAARSIRQEVSRTNSNGEVVKEIGKLWKWPAMVEDYGRAVNFINAKRMGYSDLDAQKLVNSALFDYENGLSVVEKRVLKRLIPFYSYQRFAIPLALKSIATKPGAAATPQKLFKLFENLLVTGQDLSTEQREMIPGFIVEQPHVLRGYDKDGKAVFNIANNISPFEVFNLIEYKKDGSVDIEKTAEKSTLAQLTPFLKAPLELLINKNFFDGRVIDKARLAPNDPQKYWKESKDQIRVGQLLSVLPEPVKELLGVEVKKEKDGKLTAYANPYTTYTATNAFPFLRAYVKPFEEETPLSSAMSLLLGISTQKVDFPKQAKIEMKERQAEIQKTRKTLIEARKSGDHEKFQQAQDDLRNLLREFQTISQQRKALIQQAQMQRELNPEQTVEQTFIR